MVLRVDSIYVLPEHEHPIDDVTGLQPVLTDLQTQIDALELESGGTTNLTVSRSATTVTVLSDTGSDAILLAANAANAGVMTGADKAKLDGISGSGGATNLTVSRDATTVTVASDTGTDAVIPAADTTNAGVMTEAQFDKLAGIATGATANSPDATLLARANHTGVQEISTVTGLQAAIDAKAPVSHSHLIADLPVAPSGTSNTTQVVRADDARLSNARTPTAHVHPTSDVTGLDTALAGKAPTAHTHVIGDLPVAPSGTSNTTQVVRADDARLSNARTPTTHSHAIADLPVATSGTSNTTQVVRADDLRLSNARTPTTHSHAIADLPVAASGVSSATQVVRADDARLSGASAASETVAGIAEIATQAEVTTGTDDLRFVTPLKLATRIAGIGGGGGATNLTTSRDAATVTVLSDTGTDAILAAADATNAGVMTSADKVKLDGLSGSGGSGANLTASRTATTVTVLSDTGTDAILPAASTTEAGVLVAADKVKIDGFQASIDAKAPLSHSHAIGDLPVAPSGTSNTTQVVRADDSRLSNARAPTAHSHLIADLPVAASGVSSATSVVRADDARLSDTRAPTTHSHAIADLPVATSGTSNTTQVVRADDSRLSNARTPTAHVHVIADTTGLQTALDGKAAASHSHLIADLPVATSGTSNTTQVVRADDARLSNARTPTAHVHAIADTTGLQAALDGKAATTHAHAVADVTGLQAALDGKETLGELAGVDAKVANYTLVLTDKGKVIEMNLAGANTLTVPPNSAVAFPVRTRIDLTQVGAGVTTVTPGSGVTIRQREAKLKTAGQWAGASLYKRATDEWVLFGDVAA